MSEITITFKPRLEKVGRAFREIKFPGLLGDTLKKTAFKIEAESKRFTPVDTGRLRASIYTRFKGKYKALIGPHPKVFYAGFVHWGTTRMRARPFMVWGANIVFKEIESTMKKDINKALDKAFGRL